jgi:aspartate carbamoyltransferase catalytic subunit
MAGKNLLYRRNLLSVLDFATKQEIIQILDLAKSFRDDIREGRDVQPLLQGHGMVQMFFEVNFLTSKLTQIFRSVPELVVHSKWL